MAIRFATAGDMLDTTAGAPDNTTTTFVAWVYMTSNTAANATIIRIRTAANALVTEFGTRVDGVTIRINSTGNTVNGTYVFTPGTWSKVACTIAGTSGTMYGSDAGSSTIVTNTGTLTAATAARFAIGGRGNADATGRWDGRIAGVKLYNRILTLDEIRTEWTQILPVNTEGLYAAYSLDAGDVYGVLDLSGNGRMLAQGSTLTEDGPPVPRRRILLRPQRFVVGDASSTTGSVDGALAALTTAGSLAGTVTTTGALEGALGALTTAGSLAGTVTTTGVLAGELAALTAGGDLAGTITTAGVLEGALGALATAGQLIEAGTATGLLEGALGALTLGGTLTATATIQTGGNWGDLLAILAEARTMPRPIGSLCPNDGFPLRSGPNGILFCPFDGWRGSEAQAEPAGA